jgi:hypothetical protein
LTLSLSSEPRSAVNSQFFVSGSSDSGSFYVPNVVTTDRHSGSFYVPNVVTTDRHSGSFYVPNVVTTGRRSGRFYVPNVVTTDDQLGLRSSAGNNHHLTLSLSSEPRSAVNSQFLVSGSSDLA